MKTKILVVDDDEVSRTLLEEVLRKDGLFVRLASSGEEAREIVKREKFPVVLSDIRMLEMDGLSLLKAIRREDPRAAVILMTGFGSMEGAVEAIREGAFDYVSKPFRFDDLRALIQRAARHWESHNSRKGETLEMRGKGLVGKSPQIVEIYKTLARAALSNSTVMILGETGTGKEQVARAIHENGPRRKSKFVLVSCSTLADFDSIRSAQDGTVFLDEVADLSASAQIELLRWLQQRDEPKSRLPEGRVIASTQRDLELLVKQGRFREDLYYGLKVISMELPPLRERMGDLAELVEYFLARHAQRSGKRVSHVSDEAMACLRSYAWPGNVRELEHAIERAVAMARTDVLFPEDFPPNLMARPSLEATPVSESVSSLEDVERSHILRVLQEVAYNKSRASEVLGIDRATLYRKAQRYGIPLSGQAK